MVDKRLRVLIVDDEPDIARSIKLAMEHRGFQTDIYTDPQEALRNFKPNFYDLILLDVRMPRMNGFQLYKQIIKQDERARIFFLTAYEQHHEEFKKAFPELDEERFIKKPTGANELVEHLMREINSPI